MGNLTERGRRFGGDADWQEQPRPVPLFTAHAWADAAEG